MSAKQYCSVQILFAKNLAELWSGRCVPFAAAQERTVNVECISVKIRLVADAQRDLSRVYAQL